MISPELDAVRRAITIADEREPLLTVTLPLTLVSEANAHGHWWHKAKRTAEVRRAAHLACVRLRWRLSLEHGLGADAALVVRLVRVAPRGLDSDNLARALKAVRDGVADALGIDDRNPRVTWLCDQQRGKAGVVVELYRRGGA